VNYNSCPFVIDWNEDGKKDLMTGEQSPISGNTGNIRLYLNEGANEAPVFGDYFLIDAGGSPIYIYRVNPVVYDLDMDGLKDLIAGNSNGQVYFYKNVGTNVAPLFNTTRDTLRTREGVVIDVSVGSRVHFVDWTGDGDLDMVISGYDGFVELYENGTITGVEEGEKNTILLAGPNITPNPLTDNALFIYSLAVAAHVRIDIFSVDGRLIATPTDQFEPSGQHQFTWYTRDTQGRKLPTGIYLARFLAGSEINTKSLAIIR
jgi:hypothetical protein